jgi:hypothetical protein
VAALTKADTPQLNELAQCAAVSGRLADLLCRQRDRLRNYLVVLEKQQSLFMAGDNDILAHVELEEQIIADILSMQKAIDPLEGMYRADGSFPLSDDIAGLKAALEDLKIQAKARSERNRELLAGKMAETRAEITVLRSNPFRSPYRNAETALLIDMEG